LDNVGENGACRKLYAATVWCYEFFFFLSSDLSVSWLLIRPTRSSKCHVHFCFSDTDDEDQSTEELDGLLSTHTSNYTRFFEELRKYGCNIIYLNGMKVTNRKKQWW